MASMCSWIIMTLLAYGFQILWTTTTILKLMLGLVCKPGKICKRKKQRRVPPACLMDPSLGTHEYVTANGIKFHCVSKGENTKPLMLFLHGFPEFWYSWRYQLKEFCQDYRVVAIDMRGYGETDKPQGVHNYTIDLLKEDVIQLVQVLSPERKCVLVGHDWGGVLAWEAVSLRPELFQKCIVMNCPHTRVFARHIRTWKQLMNSWYMFMFRTPFLPEFLMSMDDLGMLKSMYTGRRAGLRNRDNFTEETLEAFKYTFGRDGAMTPPINYIRNVFRTSGLAGRTSRKPIDIPVLLIWGDSDMFLDGAMADQHTNPSICTNVVIKHIPDCSHWVQQDCPELTNQYMKEFLEE